MAKLAAPFPYFGGKSTIAETVWEALGNPPNYVEPFCGSAAVLLARPSYTDQLETINDADGMVANFWRATSKDADAVAEHAIWPVNESDLHARHIWLVNHKPEISERLMADPEWYDAKAAGWWCWGMSAWIGSSFCSGEGPWNTDGERLVRKEDPGVQRVHLGDHGMGVHKKRVHLGDHGMGVHKKLVHLGDHGKGVHKKLVHLGNLGRGVHKKLVHLGNLGMGVREWFDALRRRLFRVRVCCGDWSRVTGPSVTVYHGVTGVFLDPPYATTLRTEGLYAQDSSDPAEACAKWAAAHGDDPLYRIVLAGYFEEHDHLFGPDWRRVRWKAPAGYATTDRGVANRQKECLWISPHCVSARQTSLF